MWGFEAKKGQKVHPNFAPNIIMEFHYHAFCAPDCSAADQGTNPRRQTPIYVFWWVPAVSCDTICGFLRKSAFPKAVISRKSAKFCVLKRALRGQNISHFKTLYVA